MSYDWSWQGSAYRLTSFTASNGVTTTFDYDALGRITRRYTAQGYSDYTYEDGTDWLSRETWRSYVSGNVFDLVRYWYTNGRPSRVEYVSSAPSDLSTAWGYSTFYLQYNWHGDAVTYIALDGSGGGSWGAYDPWGNPSSWPPPALAAWNYYRWNGAWGYMRFDALNLYYVHGRWYSPDTGLFLSPAANGEYLYGSGQDAMNQSWLRRQQSSVSDECSTPYYYAPKFTGGRLMNFCVAGVGACDKYYDELVEILTSPWRALPNDFCLPGDLGCWGGANYARWLETRYYDFSPFLYVPRLPEAIDPWDSPNGSKDLTQWLIQQCNTNARSVYACAMRKTINRSAVLGTAQSLEMWYDLVNTGHVWDFKPAIQRKFGDNVQLTGLWFRWDVPANIHYGFVGRASGFDATVLLAGAGIAQIKAGTSKPEYWSSWFDDPKDQAAIRVGMELYDETRGNLSEGALHRKLLQYYPQLNIGVPR